MLASVAGKAGVAPASTAGQQNYVLCGDATWKDVNTVLPTMTAATSSVAGVAGKVPIAAAGKQSSVLCGDATWKDVNTLVPTMTAATASVASVVGVVPVASAGQQNRILQANATWVEQNSQGKTTNTIQEFGVIECSTGAWDAKSLTLGGMTFTWSQAAISGGNLTGIKASGISKSQTSSGQTVRKFVGGTVTGADSLNENIWTTASVGYGTGVPMGTAYQTLEYN